MILQLHKQLLLLLLVACWTDGLEGKQYARQRRREALRGLRNVRALQATKEDDIPLDGKGMSDGKPEGKGWRKYAESGNSLDVPSTQEMDDESVDEGLSSGGKGSSTSEDTAGGKGSSTSEDLAGGKGSFTSKGSSTSSEGSASSKASTGSKKSSKGSVNSADGLDTPNASKASYEASEDNDHKTKLSASSHKTGSSKSVKGVKGSSKSAKGVKGSKGSNTKSAGKVLKKSQSASNKAKQSKLTKKGNSAKGAADSSADEPMLPPPANSGDEIPAGGTDTEAPTDAPVMETSPPTELPVEVTDPPVVEVTETPATEAPVTDPPVTEVPVSTDPPLETTDAPVEVTDAPATETPAVTDPPVEVTDAPLEVTDAPATEMPVVTEPPAEVTEAPVLTDPPLETTDAPLEVTDAPATEAPATDPPVETTAPTGTPTDAAVVVEETIAPTEVATEIPVASTAPPLATAAPTDAVAENPDTSTAAPTTSEESTEAGSDDFFTADNDNCVDAIELEVGDTVFGTTAYATNDEGVEPCDDGVDSLFPDTNDGISIQQLGVWFAVEASDTKLRASVCSDTANALAPMIVSIYAGDDNCSELSCAPVYNTAGCTVEWLASSDYEMYYIMVQSLVVEGTPLDIEMDFDFELTLSEVVAPRNDVCEEAIVLEFGDTVAAQTLSASEKDFEGSCALELQPPSSTVLIPGVWFSVIGNGDSLIASTCNESTESGPILVTIYSGSCDNLQCETFEVSDVGPCSSGVTATVEGQTYYILVEKVLRGADEGIFELAIDGSK